MGGYMQGYDVPLLSRPQVEVELKRPAFNPPAHEERTIRVHIRDVATGEERIHEDIGFFFAGDDNAFHAYIWEEGNYSCDCNRELFFLRAGGEDDPEEGANLCGEERYRIWIEAADGEIVYDERDAPLASVNPPA